MSYQKTTKNTQFIKRRIIFEVISLRHTYLSDSSRICISFSRVKVSASKPLTPTMTSPVQRTSDRCAQDPGINCVIRGGALELSLV